MLYTVIGLGNFKVDEFARKAHNSYRRVGIRIRLREMTKPKRYGYARRTARTKNQNHSKIKKYGFYSYYMERRWRPWWVLIADFDARRGSAEIASRGTEFILLWGIQNGILVVIIRLGRRRGCLTSIPDLWFELYSVQSVQTSNTLTQFWFFILSIYHDIIYGSIHLQMYSHWSSSLRVRNLFIY